MAQLYKCDECGYVGSKEVDVTDALYICTNRQKHPPFYEDDHFTSVLGGDPGNICPECGKFGRKVTDYCCPECRVGVMLAV